MTEKARDMIECPACKFHYKKYTPFDTPVKACPACGAAAPGMEVKGAPKGASRFIPRIPMGMVPQKASDATEAAKPGMSQAIETAAAAPAPGTIVPPTMPTPPPRFGPFTSPAPGSPDLEIPVCFGDPEVFQKGIFCPTCPVFEKCYPRVLIITLGKLVQGQDK